MLSQTKPPFSQFVCLETQKRGAQQQQQQQKSM